MSMRPPHVTGAFDDAAQQREASTLGMWTFLATEVLFFGVLFAGYTVLRVLWPDVFIAGSRHTDLTLGAVETGVLLVSSFTVALAVRDVQLGGRRMAHALLVATAVLGIVFLGIHAVEYHSDYQAGIIPGLRYHEPDVLGARKQLFFVLYYVTTLFHGLHVTIGVVIMAVMAWRVNRGAYDASYHTPLEVSALYWHLVDVVWIFVFPLYYQVGRA